LREALIDTLEEIGGDDAVAVSLDVLHQTTEPIEVAMLARGSRRRPGIHGEEVRRPSPPCSRARCKRRYGKRPTSLRCSICPRVRCDDAVAVWKRLSRSGERTR